MRALFSYRVLVNSLPKSGTHLLTQAVSQLGYQEYREQRGLWDAVIARFGYGTPWLLNLRQAQKARHRGRVQDNSTGIQIGALVDYSVTPNTMQDWLSQLKLGRYIQGHVPYNTHLAQILDTLNFRHVLILRDPRAVLVSLLHYIPTAHQTNMGAHFLAPDFAQLTPDQQLTLLLEGGQAPLAQVTIKPFAEVFHSLLQWRQQANCLILRFETLIGSQGGGTLAAQQHALQQLASHLNCPAPVAETEVYNRTAQTFRQGQIDGWQKGLNVDWVNRLNDYCAPLCDALEQHLPTPLS